MYNSTNTSHSSKSFPYCFWLQCLRTGVNLCINWTFSPHLHSYAVYICLFLISNSDVKFEVDSVKSMTFLQDASMLDVLYVLQGIYDQICALQGLKLLNKKKKGLSCCKDRSLYYFVSFFDMWSNSSYEIVKAISHLFVYSLTERGKLIYNATMQFNIYVCTKMFPIAATESCFILFMYNLK